MRLIDADAICSRLEDYIRDCEQEGDWLPAQVFSDAISEIQDAPTIDPEDPQPNGHWIIIEKKGYVDTSGNPIKYAECSHCSGEWTDAGTAKRYFRCCPYCGAKMDEGGEK